MEKITAINCQTWCRHSWKWRLPRAVPHRRIQVSPSSALSESLMGTQRMKIWTGYGVILSSKTSWIGVTYFPYRWEFLDPQWHLVTAVVALGCSKSREALALAGTAHGFAIFPTAFFLFTQVKDVGMIVKNDIITTFSLMAGKLLQSIKIIVWISV